MLIMLTVYHAIQSKAFHMLCHYSIQPKAFHMLLWAIAPFTVSLLSLMPYSPKPSICFYEPQIKAFHMLLWAIAPKAKHLSPISQWVYCISYHTVQSSEFHISAGLLYLTWCANHLIKISCHQTSLQIISQKSQYFIYPNNLHISTTFTSQQTTHLNNLYSSLIYVSQ